MADFGNYRRFTLRCFEQGIALISIKLKNTIITSKTYEIIRKAERQLFNECFRIIKNTIELSSLQRDTSINQWERVLDEITSRECQAFIYSIKEADTKTFWNARKLSLTDCSTKPQVAGQKMEVIV